MKENVCLGLIVRNQVHDYFYFSRIKIIICCGNSKSQKELTIFVCTSCRNNRIYQNLHFCGLDLYVRVEMVFCVFFDLSLGNGQDAFLYLFSESIGYYQDDQLKCRGESISSLQNDKMSALCNMVSDWRLFTKSV